MATSGDKTIGLVGDDIIKLALRRMRKLVAGQSIQTQDMNEARETLNAMILEWQAAGANIWTKRQVTLLLTPGTTSYSLPGYTYCMYSDDLNEVTVNGAVTAPSSTVVLSSAASVSSGDNIYIVISDTEVHATTVNGAPSGATVTLTDALSSDVPDGATVFTWTTSLANKPLRLLFAMHKNTDNDEQQVWMHTREDYLRQTEKTETGVPVKLYYNSGSSTGKLNVWPTGDDYGDRLQLDMNMPFDIFVSANDDPDFPQEWTNALAWGLCSELGPEYGIPDNRQMKFDARAGESLLFLKSYDRNNAPIPIEFHDPGYDIEGGMCLDDFQ